ncbi:MAG: hypothetical protein ACI802_003081, partial [Candidatus Paceibacteria bacterium]
RSMELTGVGGARAWAQRSVPTLRRGGLPVGLRRLVGWARGHRAHAGALPKHGIDRRWWRARVGTNNRAHPPGLGAPLLVTTRRHQRAGPVGFDVIVEAAGLAVFDTGLFIDGVARQFAELVELRWRQRPCAELFGMGMALR